MFTNRIRLRSLMIYVALAAVGLWLTVTIWRIMVLVSMLQSEAVGVFSPLFVITALGIIASLFLILFGLILLALRIRNWRRQPGAGRYQRRGICDPEASAYRRRR